MLEGRTKIIGGNVHEADVGGIGRKMKRQWRVRKEQKEELKDRAKAQRMREGHIL